MKILLLMIICLLGVSVLIIQFIIWCKELRNLDMIYNKLFKEIDILDNNTNQQKRTLRKWNYDKHCYEPYEIPDNWNCDITAKSMDELINCAQCGKELIFGDSYASLDIHDAEGFSYSVCENCSVKEIKRKLERRDENNGN